MLLLLETYQLWALAKEVKFLSTKRIRWKAALFLLFFTVVLSDMANAEQGTLIGFCRNQKNYENSWVTASHIYEAPDDQSEILSEIWGANGTWFALVDCENDGWLKVRLQGTEGYIQSEGIEIYKTNPVMKAPDGVISEGVYHVGLDIPAGLYFYSGSSTEWTVYSDCYENGCHTYQITCDRYPLYLPENARIQLTQKDTLQAYSPQKPFDESWRSSKNVRLFFPFDAPIGNGETTPSSYTCMLLDETSYIKAYDLLGNAYTIDISDIGEDFQIFLQEGSFVEVNNCILEGAFNHG